MIEHVRKNQQGTKAAHEGLGALSALILNRSMLALERDRPHLHGVSDLVKVF